VGQAGSRRNCIADNNVSGVVCQRVSRPPVDIWNTIRPTGFIIVSIATFIAVF